MITIYERATSLIVTGNPDEITKLVDSFRFRPNGYFFAVTFQRWKVTEGEEGWDGYIYPLRRINSATASALRGYKADIIKYSTIYGFELDLSHLLEYPFRNLTVEDVPADIIAGDHTLDERQMQCICSWLKAGIGFNKITVGGGKCLAKGTKVMLVDGSNKNVEDLQVGDCLMGPDSRPRRVKTLARGRAEMFKVSQRNGESYTCNGDHILALQHFKTQGSWKHGKRKYTIERVNMTVYSYLKLPKTCKLNYRGYKVAVDFRFSEVTLDAYFLGLWLGDGSRHKPVITSGDPEIVLFLRRFAHQLDLCLREEPGQGCSMWYLSRKQGSHIDGAKNPIVGKLKRLGLFGANEKWIPENYLRNCREIRLQLLAGLVDSDGYLKRSGQIEIVSVYRRLAEDVCWLARSLGFAAAVRSKKTHCQTGVTGLAYRVIIRGDVSAIPVKIRRKKSSRYTYTQLRTPLTITSVGVGDYYGFELDGDGLFLLSDFTVTHNTATFAGAAAMIKQRYPQARFLYLTPAERLVKQATKEMRKFLPHFDIGQYGGGYKQSEAQDMVICTVAMLNRNFNALQKRGWLDTFIAVLYDEVHHCGSKSNQKILAAVPAYFRLGASDTSKEKDPSRASSIRGLFGPLLNEVTSTPLLDIGRLARPNIYVVDIPSWAGRFANVSYRPALDSDAFMLLDGEWVKGVYKGPVYELDANGEVKMRQVKTAEKDDEGNWITAEEPVTVTGLHKLLIEGAELEVESRWCLLNRMYDRAIIQFKARNELIVKWAKYFSSQGWPTVIVATRTTHVYILEALVSEAVGRDNVRILIGNDSPAVRDETFQWLKQTPGSVLVSPLVKEGVSINEIRGMIVADQVADYEVARQIIGRAMRPKKSDNVCHVVWFWDKQHPVLRKGCTEVLSRLERTEGFKFVHPCSDPASAFGSG